MTETFKCGSCGAPLDYEGGNELTVKCPFCSNVTIVPEELRRTVATPGPIPADPTPPGDTPTSRHELRAKIKQMRQDERAKRRDLRHKSREARHRV